MSSFVRNKRHMFFNFKKSPAEAHGVLAEVYYEAALAKGSCRECFYQFKNSEVNQKTLRKAERLPRCRIESITGGKFVPNERKTLLKNQFHLF